MDLTLTAPVAPNGAMPGDIRATKMTLNRLGYYLPDPDIGMNDIADAGLFDAIRSFQTDQGLPATGRLSPGDRAIEAMNALNEIVMKKGKYIWRTMGDEFVRPAHADRDNEEFFWRKPPPDGHPGEPFACRCWAVPVKGSEDTADKEIIDPPIEPVYPELLLMPFLARGRIMGAVKALAATQQTRDSLWTFGQHKSKNKWDNQIKKRDWTAEQIAITLQKGKQYKAPNKVNPNNTATRYEYNGRFVVRDDKTKEILQISGKDNFKPNLKD